MGFIHSFQKYVILDSSIDANVDMDIDRVWEKWGAGNAYPEKEATRTIISAFKYQKGSQVEEGCCLTGSKWRVKTNS